VTDIEHVEQQLRKVVSRLAFTGFGNREIAHALAEVLRERVTDDDEMTFQATWGQVEAELDDLEAKAYRSPEEVAERLNRTKAELDAERRAMAREREKRKTANRRKRRARLS